MDKIVFWKNDGKTDPKLYSETARELAEAMKKDHDIKNKLNKRTQIRKFYDEVVRLDAEAKKLKVNKDEKGDKEDRKDDARTWDDILPFVHMLVAKAAYAQGRELVSKGFADFITQSVEQIEEVKDLAVFANFFEAFMGFYRLHGPRN